VRSFESRRQNPFIFGVSKMQVEPSVPMLITSAEDESPSSPGAERMYPVVDVPEARSPYHSLAPIEEIEQQLPPPAETINSPQPDLFYRVQQCLSNYDIIAALLEKLSMSAALYYPAAFDYNNPFYEFDEDQVRFMTISIDLERMNVSHAQVRELLNMICAKQRQSRGTIPIAQDIRSTIQYLATQSLDGIREEHFALKKSIAQLEQQLMVAQLKVHQINQERSLSMEPTCSTVSRDSVTSKQSIEKYQRLLQSVNHPINEHGDSLLHAICYHTTDESFVKWFLSTKVPLVNIQNAKHETPLDIAVRIHNVPIAVLLIGNGATLSVESRSILVRDLLTMEDKKAKKCLTKSLRRCINCNKPNMVNNMDRFQMTPLHWACHLHMNNTVKWLLASNAKLNEKDLLGRTPLMCASHVGNEEAIDILVKSRKIDTIAQDVSGDTALHHYMRWTFSWSKNRYEKELQNPFVTLEKCAKLFQIPQAIISDIILYHAGKLEMSETYHAMLAEALNQIVSRDDFMEVLSAPDGHLKLSNLNLNFGALNGYVDEETIKKCLLGYLRNRLRQATPHTKFYRGIGCICKVQCLGLLNISKKESDWCLLITGYGKPNQNANQFDTIMSQSGRVFTINGKSVLRLINEYNDRLVKELGSKAKKDPRWNSGAHYALRSCTGDVVVQYGPSYKKLQQTTLKNQIVGLDHAMYRFSLEDIEGIRGYKNAMLVRNTSKLTPLQLAQDAIKQLERLGYTTNK
jgi:hypothetical protein